MNKQEWKMFKKNCFDRVWFWATAVWVINLLRFPFINLLQKIKYGDKIHRILLQIRFLFKRKVVFGLFEYMVTTRCTLNCKECNTRIPKFTNETHTKITTFEEFKKDIDTLLEATDYINMFGFVGGEPMLAKDLPKMIEYVLSKKQIKRVFLATNSTILPSEELLKVMKNKRFAVLLSDYSRVKNIKNGVTVKYHEHKKILEEHGIKYNNHHEEHDAHSWFSMPKVYKDEQDPDFMKVQYRNCVQICNILIEGILIPCTMSAYIYRNLELTDEIKKEVVNVREAKPSKQLAKELIAFFSKPSSAFCPYCHFVDIKHGLLCGEQE